MHRTTVQGREAVVFRREQYLPSVVDTHHCLPGRVLKKGAQWSWQRTSTSSS